MEEVGGAPAGPYEDLEVIREDAAMPTSRFCALIGIPRRTYARWQATDRAGRPVGNGPWPAPVVDVVEPVAAKHAADWPAWGHPKIDTLMAVDGHVASVSSVQRAYAAGSCSSPSTTRGNAGSSRRPAGPRSPRRRPRPNSPVEALAALVR